MYHVAPHVHLHVHLHVQPHVTQCILVGSFSGMYCSRDLLCVCVLLCRNDILGGMWFTVCEEAWEMGLIVLMKQSSV